MKTKFLFPSLFASLIFSLPESQAKFRRPAPGMYKNKWGGRSPALSPNARKGKGIPANQLTWPKESVGAGMSRPSWLSSGRGACGSTKASMKGAISKALGGCVGIDWGDKLKGASGEIKLDIKEPKRILGIKSMGLSNGLAGVYVFGARDYNGRISMILTPEDFNFFRDAFCQERDKKYTFSREKFLGFFKAYKKDALTIDFLEGVRKNYQAQEAKKTSEQRGGKAFSLWQEENSSIFPEAAFSIWISQCGERGGGLKEAGSLTKEEGALKDRQRLQKSYAPTTHPITSKFIDRYAQLYVPKGKLATEKNEKEIRVLKDAVPHILGRYGKDLISPEAIQAYLDGNSSLAENS